MKSQNKTNYIALVILVLVLIIMAVIYAYNVSDINQNGSVVTSTSVPVTTGGTTSTATSSNPTTGRTTGSGTATSSPVGGATSTGSGSTVTAPPQNETVWQTSASSSDGVSFKYPATLSTNYVRTVDWPPVINVTNNQFICTQAGSANSPAGKTSLVTINGNPYCVTVEGNGAAGSTYYQYAYAFPKAGKTMILTFTLQYPECANYPDPQMTQCKTEETNLDINQLGNSIAQSVQYNPSTTSSTGSTTSGLSINSISPGSGAVGMTVTIVGTGFATDNKVLFGGAVAAADARISSITNGQDSLVFSVPSAMGPDCQSNQACPAYEILVRPATFSVSVENQNGVSNSVPFTVTAQ